MKRREFLINVPFLVTVDDTGEPDDDGAEAMEVLRQHLSRTKQPDDDVKPDRRDLWQVLGSRESNKEEET